MLGFRDYIARTRTAHCGIAFDFMCPFKPSVSSPLYDAREALYFFEGFELNSEAENDFSW